MGSGRSNCCNRGESWAWPVRPGGFWIQSEDSTVWAGAAGGLDRVRVFSNLTAHFKSLGGLKK